MIFKKKEIIDRPEVEKIFSLKNPEDKAIIIFLAIVLLVIVGLIIFFVTIGGFLSPEQNISSINSLGGSL